jgi:predicted nucleic acid-binding protein
MRYLLDTTVLIDFAHGTPAAKALIETLFGEPNDLYTCDVVTAESLSRGEAAHRDAVIRMLDVLEYVSTTPAAARWAGDSRRRRSAGGNRSLGDALIAGTAWALEATVVTRNPEDFVSQGIPVLAY